MQSDHSNIWQPNEKFIQLNYDEIVISLTTDPTRPELNLTRPLPPGYEQFILNCAKIGAFLMDKEAVIRQLKKLNRLLLTEATNRNFKEDTSDGYLKHNKLLRDVLENELSKFGFQKDLAKATSFVREKVFRNALKEGYLIKDPGAVIEHGEFSHAVQWLLIAWQQEEFSFLDSKVIDIFKALGDDKAVFLEKDERSIWDLLVDRLPFLKPIHEYDCRYPENLQSTILNSDDNELAFLKSLFCSRTAKRTLANESIFKKESSKPTNKGYEASPLDQNLLIPKKIEKQ